MHSFLLSKASEKETPAPARYVQDRPGVQPEIAPIVPRYNRHPAAADKLLLRLWSAPNMCWVSRTPPYPARETPERQPEEASTRRPRSAGGGRSFRSSSAPQFLKLA